jgi:hypothetical protein
LDGGSARREAATYTSKHKQDKRRHTDTSRVGLEPTIPLFEHAKTFQALDRSANTIGNMETLSFFLSLSFLSFFFLNLLLLYLYGDD